MALKYLIDTNCINYLFLKTDLPLQKSIAKGALVFISVVTVIEFGSNPNLLNLNRVLFETLVENANILDVKHEDNLLIQKTISLRKKYKLKTPDAIIAAQAVLNNLILVTNDESFCNIFGLQIEKL